MPRLLEKSAEMSLPDLTGTVKQIAWATTIRLQKFENVFKDANRQIEAIKKSQNLIDKKPIGIAMIKNALNWFIDAHTSASYWIDEKDTWFRFTQIFNDYAKTSDGMMMKAVIGGTASSEEIVAVEEMTAVKAERGTTAEITTKTTKNKYNKSAIMRRAWELKRTTNDTFSVCLKKAWAEAKSAH